MTEHVYDPISEHSGILPAILAYRKKETMSSPALQMFQQLWGSELHGHPRFYELLAEIGKLHSTKSHDYDGDGPPFVNYRRSRKIGIEPWRAVLSRMGDKWSRLESFAQKGQYQVTDESFEDTLKDMAVMSLIVLILYEEEKRAKQETVPTQAAEVHEPGDRGSQPS